jgi:hypothetical protein
VLAVKAIEWATGLGKPVLAVLRLPPTRHCAQQD